MVNQISALSPPGRVTVSDLPCIDPCSPFPNHCSYSGRLMYGFRIINPMLLTKSKSELCRARCIVAKYRKSIPLPACLRSKDIYKAHLIYSSAFHPITGEKMNQFGRYCAQYPIGALLIGSVLTYSTRFQPIVITHTLNQSYLTFVHTYVQSANGNFDLLSTILSLSGIATAVGTANLYKKYTRCSSPLIRRFGPLAAVCTATLVAIPLGRIREIIEGTPVYDEKYKFVGNSSKIANKRTVNAILKHLFTVVPGMVISPFVIQNLYLRGFICRYPWSVLPVNVGIMLSTMMLTMPMSFALFPTCGIRTVSNIEPHIKNLIFASSELN